MVIFQNDVADRAEVILKSDTISIGQLLGNSYMKRFFIAFLSLTVVVSMTLLFFNIKFRVERCRWIITTAKITFIGLPDGTVLGTFTDCDGKVHSEHRMYTDGRFQPYISSVPIESYFGNTVRIMYDPSTLVLEEKSHTTANNDGETVVSYKGIKIESYDNWLRYFIISGIAFLVSSITLVVVCVKSIRKKKISSRRQM